jgi:capsular polysaccharide biosynthesis protein
MGMMRVLCDIKERQIFWFEPDLQTVDFREVLVPTYGHANYHLHPATEGFWPKARRELARRKLCISRLNYEGQTDGVLKSFANRAVFEELAVKNGFQLVYPETLSLLDQVGLFSQASHIVGEYGSALHNSLFSPAGTTVGAIRCPNDVQLRISALREQKSVLLIPGHEWINDRGGQAYAVEPDTIPLFFEAVCS